MSKFLKIIGIFLILEHALIAEKESNKNYKIIVTFSILKDLTQNIIGTALKDKITIHSIVPLMNDPHVYQLKPRDIILLQSADLIIMNGLGFEEWLERIISQPRYIHKFIKIGDMLPYRKNDTVNVYDPHLWHDVLHAIEYVNHIEKALSELIPHYKHIFKENANVYRKKLIALHHYLLSVFNNIPSDKKFIVTTHDAFWYFGKRYGLTFLSPIGLSTEEEPTPQKICALIEVIKQHNIKAIFVENLSSQKQIDVILKETKTCLGGMLYADSLSSIDGPASSFIDMIAHNVNTILKTLE
jgi:zinc/manganese transport system substrate-binding protein